MAVCGIHIVIVLVIINGKVVLSGRLTGLNSFHPFFFTKDFIYLFLERGEGKEKEGEEHRCVMSCTGQGNPFHLYKLSQ